MRSRFWVAALAGLPLAACVRVEQVPYYAAPPSQTAAGAVTGAAAGGLLGAILGQGGGAIIGGAAAGALVGGLIGNSVDQRDATAAQGYYAQPPYEYRPPHAQPYAQPYQSPYGQPYPDEAPRHLW